jgi:hypothetical protein
MKGTTGKSGGITGVIILINGIIIIEKKILIKSIENSSID